MGRQPEPKFKLDQELYYFSRQYLTPIKFIVESILINRRGVLYEGKYWTDDKFIIESELFENKEECIKYVTERIINDSTTNL